MTAFLWLIRRDMLLACRQGGDAVMAVLFFVLAAALFPFGIGPEPAILARVAAGIIWVTALLAALLALDRLFQADWEDGTLDLLAASALPLELAVLACRCCWPRRWWRCCCIWTQGRCRRCWPPWRSARPASAWSALWARP
jgi:ABC-type transport system involved in cytochrome c biogenesis permease component